VRAGKEMLSRGTTTLVHVPLLEVEAPIGREELEEVAAPILDRTVAAVQAVLARAGVGTGEVAAVFLAGGSSRIPAVGTLLHRALGIRPTIVEQPEMAVAEGSLRTVESATVEEPTTAATGLPPAVPAPTAPGRRGVRLAVAVGLTLALLSGAVVAELARGDDNPGTLAGATPSPTPSPTPSASPSPNPFPVDPCMVGTWRSLTRQSYNTIDGDEVQFSGGAGVIMTTRANGTFTTDFNRMKGMTANHDGVRWTQEITGSVSGNVTHRDGLEYVTNLKSRGKISLKRNGRLNNQIPLSLVLDGNRYACSETSLRYFGGGFAAEYVRVSQ
jgi:molecular chaperone DnaK